MIKNLFKSLQNFLKKVFALDLDYNRDFRGNPAYLDREEIFAKYGDGNQAFKIICTFSG
jgi:hypothetical protein